MDRPKTGMLYPTIAELTKGGVCRYALVIATAKRARQLAASARNSGAMLDEKPVKTAINEIASGRVRIVEYKD
ncbi:MAG TPA: DNA-directed RNA polymerase subunit omega [Candidatus Acidoferrum sp.]|nr:DNA-directed RNA polymerase subunit omega [Candidatus Acidoferrum sp.]